MKTLHEIIEEKKVKKETRKYNEELVSGIGGSMKEHGQHSTSMMIDALEQIGERWDTMSQSQQTKLQEEMAKLADKIPQPELSINFNGLKKIAVDTMEVTGLNDSMMELCEHVEKMTTRMETAVKDIQFTLPTPDIKVNVPPLKQPNIQVNVPKIDIPRINIPPINVPKAEVSVSLPKEDYPRRLKIERDKFGNWQKMTETYDSGQVIVKRLNSGEIEFDDRRQRVT
ncbi:MAG: hypothetical protein NUV80_04465 [Candidatus Berkelbacteria bacterium]|nr:hypothetical protein [Candidatus Berkelbacteria bacterium]